MASSIDVTKLTPVSREVMSKQATINIGTIGHVAHGKSTVVRALSGVQTVRFKNEKERNITIKLGYANAKLYKCSKCEPPGAYSSHGSDHQDDYPCPVAGCDGTRSIQRHVSFVDCPGHDILMATMLNGAAVMDAALLLVAGNEPCPQPQTSEHLAAVEIMKLRHLIVLQNKVELVKEDQCQVQQEQIREFVKGTAADNAPIVPISAILKYNVDVVIQYMCTRIAVPVRDFSAKPEMIVIRSFDVNKPGDPIDTMVGGVAGGSILRGVFRLGDEIECRPGVVIRNEDETFTVRPIRSKITSLHAEHNQLEFAVPGGLIGAGSLIDPALTRGDSLVGQVLGHPGAMADVYDTLEINFYLLRRLIGVKVKRTNPAKMTTSSAAATEAQSGATGGNQQAQQTQERAKASKVKPLDKGEYLMVNIGSTSVGARIASVKNDVAKFKLASPVCTKVGDKVALSRRVDKNWRLIGWGQIYRGKSVPLQECF